MADMTYEQYIAGLQARAEQGDSNAIRKLQEMQAFSQTPGLNQQQQITNAQDLATDPAATMQQNSGAILQPSSGAENVPVSTSDSDAQSLISNGGEYTNVATQSAPVENVAPPSAGGSMLSGAGAGLSAGLQAGRAGGRKVSKGESIGTGAAEGALQGAEVGGPYGAAAGAVIGGAMGAMGGGDEPDTTQEKILKEQLRTKEIKNDFVDPTNSMDAHGNKSNLYLLAHYGPLSRIPAVANWGLKMSGEDPLTKREAILNFLRPPIPMYNAAKADKATSEGLAHKRMLNVVSAIGLGVGALNALGNVGKSMVMK